MNDKERERIKEKYLKSDKHKRRMRRYARKVAMMTESEREAEQKKEEQKLAKLSDAEWLRKHNLRYAGCIVLAFFVVVYAVLWLVGVSIRSIWGAGLISAITFLFLLVVASFMDVYRNAGKEEDDVR